MTRNGVDESTADCRSPGEAVAVEVKNSSGDWVGGYELLQFHEDGRVTIRSMRSSATRNLTQEQWRDPIEESLLKALGIRA